MIQQRVGIETITHRASRDHNLIGLQAELLGAYALGIRNILCVTGDPASIGDYPHATSVYDVDSVGMVRSLDAMNHGSDIMGNPIGEPTSFMIACAANPAESNMEVEIEKIRRKVDAGANILFTQPVFEMQMLERYLKLIEPFRIPVMVGIIPLRSYKHADFLHNEIPGMKIPEWIREKLRTQREDAGKVGVQLAMEFLKEAKSAVAGAYFMPPFKKYHIVDELLSVL
jgi:homocysteine S-methyltransferase